MTVGSLLSPIILFHFRGKKNNCRSAWKKKKKNKARPCPVRDAPVVRTLRTWVPEPLNGSLTSQSDFKETERTDKSIFVECLVFLPMFLQIL